MKKTVSILLAVVILTLCIPGTALAVNETEGSTAVSYTVSNEGYIINIPSSINLNQTNCLEITASRMNTSGYVWVYIDTDRTAITGNALCLENAYGQTVLCDLIAGPAGGDTGTMFPSAINYRVASFSPYNTTPDEYGKLYFEIRGNAAEPGEYTGIIYFTILGV